MHITILFPAVQVKATKHLMANVSTAKPGWLHVAVMLKANRIYIYSHAALMNTSEGHVQVFGETQENTSIPFAQMANGGRSFLGPAGIMCRYIPV